MIFFNPFKLIFKGKYIPGFVVNVNSNTTVETDNSTKSIKEDIIPMIQTIGESVYEELSDSDKE